MRAPLSQEKILAAEDKVIYHSKINPNIRSNFRIYNPLDWIALRQAQGLSKSPERSRGAAITSHIPDKGQQMVRYYGYYSNVKRGKLKKKIQIAAECLSIKEPLLSSKEYRRRCAELIKKVYEVDPLICPKCGGNMSIIAFTTEKLMIDKILIHLGLLKEHSHSPPQQVLPVKELTYVPCYD